MGIFQGKKIRSAIVSAINILCKKKEVEGAKQNVDDFNKNTMAGALQRCKERNLHFKTVLDVGASNGMWSGPAMSFFPESFYYLIEAQAPHEEALIAFKKKHPNSDYIMAAAGDIDGTLYFHNQDLFGGAASHEPCGEYTIRVPSVRIDTVVEQQNLTPPFFIKLDTHGFETQIFAGAQKTLKQTSLILVEAYNFRLRPDALMFHEMCTFLEAYGFRCIDFCDLLYRPKDHALWQMDMFFIRSDSIEFQQNTWE